MSESLQNEIREGFVAFVETDSYYGEGYNEDGVSMKRARHGYTRYIVNGVEMSEEDVRDALERAGYPQQ